MKIIFLVLILNPKQKLLPILIAHIKHSRDDRTKKVLGLLLKKLLLHILCIFSLILIDIDFY
jgi:hypothetical protein